MVINMININVKEIEQETSNLRKLLIDYEKNYETLFKELSDASFSWTDDGNAKKFFNGLKYEKDDQDSFNTSIEGLYKVYDYLSKKYKRIGNKINVSIEERDNILAKFNKCINETTELISLYKHLDVSFCASERAIIKNQIQRLYNLKNQYTATKERVKETLDNIDTIETEIRSRLGEIEVGNIRFFDENAFFKE